MEESRDSLKTNLLEEDNPKAAGAQCHSHTNHPLNTHLQDIQQFDEKLCAANHIGHSKCAHTPPKERHILSSPAAKKLITASVICALFMLVELVAGFVANSLALMTDASHLLSDFSSFLISIFALWLSDLRGNQHLSFGYARAEILGAIGSVILIWGCCIVLLWQARARLITPQPVKGGIMLLTASLGTAANVLMTYLLGAHSHGIGHVHTHEDGHCSHGHTHTHTHDTHTKACEKHMSDEEAKFTHSESSDAEAVLSNHEDSISLRAAYIHAVGDLIQNVGVMIAAAIIWFKPEYSIADPICTLVFTVLVLFTTVSIIREATTVLMEGTPQNLDIKKLEEDLLRIHGVREMHDLHVWSLSIGKPAMAVHLVATSATETHQVLKFATEVVQKKYKILHTTIQVDLETLDGNSACDTGAHAKCHTSSHRSYAPTHTHTHTHTDTHNHNHAR